MVVADLRFGSACPASGLVRRVFVLDITVLRGDSLRRAIETKIKKKTYHRESYEVPTFCVFFFLEKKKR